MLAIPIHRYAWQLVYIHGVTDTNESFHFVRIGREVSTVLLRREIALFKKCFNQNIKINNLFIEIESWSTFVKLVENSVLKKKIISRMWRNVVFPCDSDIFFRIFPLFVCLFLFSVCGSFISNMGICFWCQYTRIIWIVSKFDLFRYYYFRIKIIHQIVRLILVIAPNTIQ